MAFDNTDTFKMQSSFFLNLGHILSGESIYHTYHMIQ